LGHPRRRAVDAGQPPGARPDPAGHGCACSSLPAHGSLVMKLAVSADTVKSALSAHAAIGLIGGALLYLLCLSGTVLVLYEEWQRFEQQDAPEMQSISPAAVQRGISEVIATEADRTPTTHLYVHMPTTELPRTTITTDHQAFHLTPDGSIA